MVKTHKEHEAASFHAFQNQNFYEQAEHAKQALILEPSSPSAALLFFLAHWDANEKAHAAKFIQRHVKKHGATTPLLLCCVYAMLEQGEPLATIDHYASLYLSKLTSKDLRKSRYRDSKSNFRLLKLSLLASLDTITGPVIADSLGPIGPVKSTSPIAMNARWPQPTYHVVKGVSVLPKEWFLFDDNNIYLTETHDWPQRLSSVRALLPPLSATIIAIVGETALVNIPSDQQAIEGRCLLLGSNVNYFFWLTQHLARFKTIEDLFDIQNIPILIDKDLPDTHYESLKQLGIRDENVIECDPDTALFCEELIVPAPLACVDVLHPAGISWLRSTFGPSGRDLSYPSKVFVSRSKPHRRRFVNEDDVFTHLKKLGFVKVTPDAMSFAEQNTIFQNRTIIVGPFGTCLA